MSSALADATSPYLLQHAENPVDWVEWGPEAQRRDVSILLSVGYSACHRPFEPPQTTMQNST